MPHDNQGRIYIDTQTGKGIDVRGDIAYVLGRSTWDIGLLCSDQEWYTNGSTQALRRVNKINKWAKYKPVILSDISTISQMNATTKRWNNNATWWRGRSGLCGFENIRVFNEFGDPFSLRDDVFAKLLYNLQLPWDYVPPTNTPFRAFDFLQYYGAAIQPFAELQQTDIPVQSGVVTIPFDLPTLDSDNLALSDLIIAEVNPNKPLSQWYLGGLFVNGSNFVVALSSNPMGASDLQIVIDDSDTVHQLQGKTWNFVPFFAENTSNPITSTSNFFISMGATERKAVSILKPGYNLNAFVSAIWNVAGTQISWELEVVNSTSGAISCGIGSIGIYNNNPDQGTAQQVATSGNISIGTVQGNSRVTRSGVINVTKTSTQYWAKFAFNDTQLVYTSTAQPIEDADEPLE